MNKKASDEIGGGLVMIPIMFFIFLILLLFIFASYTASKTRAAQENDFSAKIQSDDTNILFKSIDLEIGNLVLLKNEDAHLFDGRKFLESSYVIVPKEQTSGLTGETKIYGIQNESRTSFLILEAFIFIINEKDDYSYYRYITEEEVRKSLNKDKTFDDTRDICFSLISEDYRDSQNPFLRYFFFERKKGESEFKSLVQKRGKVAQLPMIDTNAYISKSFEFQATNTDGKKNIYSYYGDCLK